MSDIITTEDTAVEQQPQQSEPEYDLKNVIAFPRPNAQSKSFRLPTSAVTARFAEPTGTMPPIPTVDGTIDIQEFVKKELTTLHEKRREMIHGLCDIYAREMFFKLYNLGFNVLTEEFDKDMHFVSEALHSALLRTYKVEHPLQDYIDECFTLVAMPEGEENDEDKS
jgi:hypothetical protein